MVMETEPSALTTEEESSVAAEVRLVNWCRADSLPGLESRG